MIPLFILTIEDVSQRMFMEQLYLDHRSCMYRVAMGVLQHTQDSEDVIQAVFLTLCEKIPQLMRMSCYNLRSYIVISVRNAAIDLIRKRNRQPELLWGDETYLDTLLDTPVAMETALFALMEQETLNQAILRLSKRDRVLLEMKYILGQKDADIAKVLGVTPDSVRPLLARVKNRLCAILKEEEHEG